VEEYRQAKWARRLCRLRTRFPVSGALPWDYFLTSRPDPGSMPLLPLSDEEAWTWMWCTWRLVASASSSTAASSSSERRSPLWLPLKPSAVIARLSADMSGIESVSVSEGVATLASGPHWTPLWLRLESARGGGGTAPSVIMNRTGVSLAWCHIPESIKETPRVIWVVPPDFHHSTPGPDPDLFPPLFLESLRSVLAAALPGKRPSVELVVLPLPLAVSTHVRSSSGSGRDMNKAVLLLVWFHTLCRLLFMRDSTTSPFAFDMGPDACASASEALGKVARHLPRIVDAYHSSIQLESSHPDSLYRLLIGSPLVPHTPPRYRPMCGWCRLTSLPVYSPGQDPGPAHPLTGAFLEECIRDGQSVATPERMTDAGLLPECRVVLTLRSRHHPGAAPQCCVVLSRDPHLHTLEQCLSHVLGFPAGKTTSLGRVFWIRSLQVEVSSLDWILPLSFFAGRDGSGWTGSAAHFLVDMDSPLLRAHVPSRATQDPPETLGVSFASAEGLVREWERRHTSRGAVPFYVALSAEWDRRVRFRFMCDLARNLVRWNLSFSSSGSSLLWRLPPLGADPSPLDVQWSERQAWMLVWAFAMASLRSGKGKGAGAGAGAETETRLHLTADLDTTESRFLVSKDGSDAFPALFMPLSTRVRALDAWFLSSGGMAPTAPAIHFHGHHLDPALFLANPHARHIHLHVGNLPYSGAHVCPGTTGPTLFICSGRGGT
jgi:hypothetical protein